MFQQMKGSLQTLHKALHLPLIQRKLSVDDEHELSLQPSYWHWESDVQE